MGRPRRRVGDRVAGGRHGAGRHVIVVEVGVELVSVACVPQQDGGEAIPSAKMAHLWGMSREMPEVRTTWICDVRPSF